MISVPPKVLDLVLRAFNVMDAGQILQEVTTDGMGRMKLFGTQIRF